MQKSSWIILGICALLAALLGFGYVASKSGDATLTQAQAETMLAEMRDAVSRKSVNRIMNYVSSDPDVRLANLKPDELRQRLAIAFRYTGDLQAKTTNLAFQSSGDTATLAFDLSMTNVMQGGVGTGLDYTGRITLHLRRTDTSHMLGLYHTPEWRIVGAETTGRDPSTFGDTGM